MLGELRKVARGWRWGRPAPRPQHAPTPPVRTEAAFETDWAREPWARAARGVIQEMALLPALRYVASPRVSGRERLERVRPPAVVVANHASHLDTSIVIEALPMAWRERLAIGAAADYFFTSNVRGWAAALGMGAFPIERKRASAVSARYAVRLLEEGFTLVLFPEGGRSTDGWLQEVKPGAAFAATKTGRPVVPMWISGTDHLFPKGAKRIKRGRVDILIGDALYPAPGEGPRDLNPRIEASLRRLAQESTEGWWQSLRHPDEGPYGPDAARWRRIWARGEGDRPVRADWR